MFSAELNFQSYEQFVLPPVLDARIILLDPLDPTKTLPISGSRSWDVVLPVTIDGRKITEIFFVEAYYNALVFLPELCGHSTWSSASNWFAVNCKDWGYFSCSAREKCLVTCIEVCSDN